MGGLGGLIGLVGGLSQPGQRPIGCGAIGQQAAQGRSISGFDMAQIQAQAQAHRCLTGGTEIKFKEVEKEKTVIQELQAETDEWLKDIK